MKYRIAIADDHILIAKALTGIIENFKGFEVLYECENGLQLQEHFKDKNAIPDVVLMDINMPVMDGMEATQWITDHHPQVLVMALSMQDDEKSLLKMIRAGAKGYLLKNTHPAELEQALQKLVKNGSYFPDWASSKIMLGLSNTHKNLTASVEFSEREKEFLKYSITELSYKEIGEKMFCSPRTVESYRDSLFQKLDLKTRVGLAVFALKNGLAE